MIALRFENGVPKGIDLIRESSCRIIKHRRCGGGPRLFAFPGPEFRDRQRPDPRRTWEPS